MSALSGPSESLRPTVLRARPSLARRWSVRLPFVSLLAVSLLAMSTGCGKPYRVESDPPGAWVRWKPGGGKFLTTPCEVTPGMDCGLLVRFVSVNWLGDDTSSEWQQVDGRSVYKFVKPAPVPTQAEIEARRAEEAAREAAEIERQRAAAKAAEAERLEVERQQREAARARRIATLRDDLRRIDIELAKLGLDEAFRKELEIERRRIEAALAEIEASSAKGEPSGVGGGGE
jgi:hypothetical protein